MARTCNMQTLVESIPGSPQARERVKAIFLTLSGKWSVQAGCDWLHVKRTQFQELRKRVLAASVLALEERAAGRPRIQVGRACRQLAALRRRLTEVEHELRRTQAELDIARSEAGPAVTARLAAKGGR